MFRTATRARLLQLGGSPNLETATTHGFRVQPSNYASPPPKYQITSISLHVACSLLPIKIRDAVVHKPRLLGMSLEKRLLPRLQKIRTAGFTPSWDLHHEASRGACFCRAKA